MTALNQCVHILPVRKFEQNAGGKLMIIIDKEHLGLNLLLEAGVDYIKQAVPQYPRKRRGLQLTFVMKGTLAWQAPDGRILQPCGGELCLTQPGMEFLTEYNVLTPCDVLWLQLNPGAPDAAAGTFFSQPELDAMAANLTQAGNMVLPVSENLQFHLHGLRSYLEGFGAGQRSALAANRARLNVLGILIECCALCAPDRQAKGVRGHLGLNSRIRKLVLEKPGARHSCREIAKALKLSVSLLEKKSLRELGFSVADFVRRLKCEEAVRLMKKPTCSITEIAYALGFSSSQHFATVFRKYYGASPSRFRKKIAVQQQFSGTSNRQRRDLK
jgi:AraC-like DNA-binding protein